MEEATLGGTMGLLIQTPDGLPSFATLKRKQVVLAWRDGAVCSCEVHDKTRRMEIYG